MRYKVHSVTTKFKPDLGEWLDFDSSNMFVETYSHHSYTKDKFFTTHRLIVLEWVMENSSLCPDQEYPRAKCISYNKAAVILGQEKVKSTNRSQPQTRRLPQSRR
jgi:hypothetical protein